MALRDQGTRTVESPAWVLRDDTEESVVGAEWHQLAIRNLVGSLRAVAQAQALPWHVGDQLALLGWRPDGTDWRPSPDVSVHATAGPKLREELSLREEGIPALLIEVLSPSTWRNDLHLTERPMRKPYGYLHVWRVPEYLVFDPHGEHVPTQCRGWRWAGDALEEWRPDATGRYASALGVSFAPEEVLLRVYGPDGAPLPFEDEQPALLAEARRHAEEERQRAEEERQRADAERVARLDAEQRAAALEAELRRLRGQSE